MTKRDILVSEPSLGKHGLKVCVFCSANDVGEKYVEATQTLARLLAENGHTLVYGGSEKGLMKVIASGVQAAGGKVIGVSVEYLKDAAKQDADEMIIAKDLGERKAVMLERSDVLVMLVGGIGTLDEVTEVIEHKKHGHHNKPIIVLNTNGFYEGLQLQLQRMEQEGFFWHPLKEYVQFIKTPEAAVDYINSIK
jgi:uncharacterized protein (TIGR00730 family)